MIRTYSADNEGIDTSAIKPHHRAALGLNKQYSPNILPGIHPTTFGGNSTDNENESRNDESMQ